MAEKGLVCTAEEVRAFLDDRKTQARRPIKPQPPDHLCDISPILSTGSAIWQDKDGCRFVAKSPYQVGDRIYVKETWCPGYFADGRVGYKADWHNPDPRVVAETKWRSSIHMPKWAARIWREVTGVRAEKVQEITVEDADAEGFGGDFPEEVFPEIFYYDDMGQFSIPECYGFLWDSICGKKYPWESNPWAWVYELRRIDG